jgi:peptide deformylase
MTATDVLLLGDPRLRERSAEVVRFDDRAFHEGCERLAATLAAFRATHGFGRAIAAPQIGISMRFIAVDLGGGTFFIVNPVIAAQSEKTFTMWDDCMSFPDLLVRVERFRSISLRYVDQSGKKREWHEMDLAASELLQHEIDHLDGVLAVDRRLDGNSLLLKALFDQNREMFTSMVDYTIGGGASS